MMRLAETEYRVGNLVWAEEGITAKNLAEALRHSIGWSKTTTYTIISRCIQKGYIRREEPKFHCYSLVSRDWVGEQEADALIGRYYADRPEQLVASLLARGKLTAGQLSALGTTE